MSTPLVLEHDYIGLAENPSSMDGIISEDGKSSTSSLNLKETELRLGLPGCERKSAASSGVSLFGKDLQNNKHNAIPLKKKNLNLNLVAGAKRGFSDAINIESCCGKWVFSDGSEEVGVGNGKNLVTLEANKTNNTQQHKGNINISSSQTIIKEVGVVPQSAKQLVQENNPHVVDQSNEHGTAPYAKAQVVGWPPIRSFRKNSMASNLTKNSDVSGEGISPGFGFLYVKVSMDGAPYLRKIDLKNYTNYMELSSALEKMFSCFTIGQCNSPGLPGKHGLSESSLRDLLHGSEFVLTYEDKDGDWMLVGDVPWEMFTESCRRLRIMKGSEAIGLASRDMEKSRSQN